MLIDSAICREIYIFAKRLYISALEHTRALILGKYVLLGSMNNYKSYINYKSGHA